MPAERKYLTNQIPCPLSCLEYLFHLVSFLGFIFTHIECKFRITYNCRQYVIKVVRDSSSKGPYCLHPLRVIKLSLKLFVFQFSFFEPCYVNPNAEYFQDRAISIVNRLINP